MNNKEIIDLLRRRNINLIQQNITLKKKVKELEVQAETSNRITQTQLGLF